MKSSIKCGVCENNYKDTVITKCFHTFCKGCINKALTSRARICPHCREKFGENDLKTFYLNY